MLQSLTNASILLSNLQNIWFLLHEQDTPKILQYPAAASINIYFYLNYTYQIGLLKTGVGLFNCSYKTIY